MGRVCGWVVRHSLDNEGLGVKGERSQKPGRDGVVFGAGLQHQAFVAR